MNNERRQAIEDLESRLSILSDEIESLLGEEQEALDNLPESFRNSERGEQMETAVSNLGEALSSIGDALSSLETSRE